MEINADIKKCHVLSTENPESLASGSCCQRMRAAYMYTLYRSCDCFNTNNAE